MLKLDLQLFAEGENDQEVADPETETELEEQPEGDPEEDQSEETQEVADPEPERDFEKDKAYAELRRKAEDAERRAAKADQWAKDNYGHMGVNTLEDYQNLLAEEKKREEYEAQGIDYDAVRKIAKEEAENHPDVKKAKEIELKFSVNAEIRALKNAYPDVEIAEIEDLRDLGSQLEKLPNWPEIKKKLDRNYELTDAYELANRDTLMGKRTAAAAQAARNAANSKNHLKPSGTQTVENTPLIDDEEMAMFKRLMPKKTEAEIIAWKKQQKKKA